VLLVAFALAQVIEAHSPIAAQGEKGLAFAAPFSASLRAQPLTSSFTGSSVTTEIEGATTGLTMSCRRNLKKEKRQRNEVMARQFRKPTFGRFGRGRGGRGGGRGGGRAAAAQAEEADSEWLDQIYGQHTIYRRDEGKPAMGATKEEEAKTEEAATA